MTEEAKVAACRRIMGPAENVDALNWHVGFQNSFETLPLAQRVTHPANHGYLDATFDYLFGKNLKTGKAFATPTEVSDH